MLCGYYEFVEHCVAERDRVNLLGSFSRALDRLGRPMVLEGAASDATTFADYCIDNVVLPKFVLLKP
jgi:hypothetical protein